jgi:hypothetical protein
MDDYSIWGKLTEVYTLIRLARSAELQKIDLTPEQSKMIRVLMTRNGNSTIKEISEIMLKRHNTISLIVNPYRQENGKSWTCEKGKNSIL